MRHRFLTIIARSLAATAIFVMATLALAQDAFACDAGVTFDGLAAGTVFSAATGFMPGDVVLVEDNIIVTTRPFLFPGGGGAYGAATITNSIPAPVDFDLLRICRENNINLMFDLRNLGLVVTRVTFDWLDQGGFENLRVNGAPIFIGELDMAPAAIAPGVVYAVADTPVPGGQKGRSRLDGPVRAFMVGGQEFAIDRICVEGFVPGTGEQVRITMGDATKDAWLDDLDLDEASKAAATESSTWGAVKTLFQ